MVIDSSSSFAWKPPVLERLQREHIGTSGCGLARSFEPAPAGESQVGYRAVALLWKLSTLDCGSVSTAAMAASTPERLPSDAGAVATQPGCGQLLLWPSHASSSAAQTE